MNLRYLYLNIYPVIKENDIFRSFEYITLILHLIYLLDLFIEYYRTLWEIYIVLISFFFNLQTGYIPGRETEYLKQ